MAALNFYCLYSHQCGVQSRGRPASVAAGCIMSWGTGLYTVGSGHPGLASVMAMLGSVTTLQGCIMVWIEDRYYLFYSFLLSWDMMEIKSCCDIACFIESVLMIHIPHTEALIKSVLWVCVTVGNQVTSDQCWPVCWGHVLPSGCYDIEHNIAPHRAITT